MSLFEKSGARREAKVAGIRLVGIFLPWQAVALTLAVVVGLTSVAILRNGSSSVRVEQTAATADSTNEPTAPSEPTSTTTTDDLEQRVTDVEAEVKVIEKRVVIVERQLTTTTSQPTTTWVPPSSTTTTTLPDGEVTKIEVERLWDEPRRSRTGEVDIRVTVSVDAPIYHSVSILVKIISVWTASSPPTETSSDMVVYFPGGITDTATKTATTVAKVDRVEAGGWRIEPQPAWRPVPTQ